MSFFRKHGNGFIAILLAGLTAVILIATNPTIGVTWDEPNYMGAAHSYATWSRLFAKSPMRALQAGTIENYWDVNHEHPPLAKLWSGIVWLVSRHFVNDLLANRLGNILLVSLLVALLYLLISGTYGKAAGMFSVAALLSMPRFFYTAHEVSLDVPMAVASFVLTFLFWKTVDRKSWLWGAAWGVGWGLALATKINGVLIPIAFIIWLAVFRRKWSMVLRLFLMGIIAIPTFLMVWPWLYHQTWPRVVEYVLFFLNHSDYANNAPWYLGRIYLIPPWHYVFVILWAVVPLTVTFLYLAGMFHAGKGKRDGGLAWLLTISALVSILPFIFGKVQVYGHERLFMSVIPFLAALAGIGFSWLAGGLRKLLGRAKRPALAIPATLIMGAVLLVPQLVSMTSLYPHLLSYYSEGVGGLPGATKLGLETTYKCETFASAIPYINAHANPNDSIWSENSPVLKYYQEIGVLRQDVSLVKKLPEVIPGLIGYGKFENANWYIFEYRQSQFRTSKGYLAYQILKTQTPVFELNYQGVPLMAIYSALK